jgi:hypothetical protein
MQQQQPAYSYPGQVQPQQQQQQQPQGGNLPNLRTEPNQNKNRIVR